MSVLVVVCSQKLEPESSCNFVRNIDLSRVSWKNHLPIILYINNSVPEQYRKSIFEAAEKWNLKLSKKVFLIRDQLLTSSRANKDGQSVIYWDLNWSGENPLEQARTTIFWTGTTIDEADIKINSRYFKFSDTDFTPPDQVDFESLMVHELGHVLGLQHIEKGHQSVMEPQLASGDNMRRNPGKYDLDSLKCEYYL